MISLDISPDKLFKKSAMLPLYLDEEDLPKVDLTKRKESNAISGHNHSYQINNSGNNPSFGEEGEDGIYVEPAIKWKKSPEM